MENGRDVVPSTILSLLARLERRGFLRKEKQGNINYYYAQVEKAAYLKEEGQRVLDKMFGSSLKILSQRYMMTEGSIMRRLRSCRRLLMNRRQRKREMIVWKHN